MSTSENNDVRPVHAGLVGLNTAKNALWITQKLLNTYDSVVIGEQEWMTRNLNVCRFRNGDSIPEAVSTYDWVKAGIEGKPAWCYYNNDPANGRIYGKLYNWFAMNDPRQIAPQGWRVPNHDDWEKLEAFLGGYNAAGGKMKEAGEKHWHQPNEKATNLSGFSGVPGGYRASNYFNEQSTMAFWWSKSGYIRPLKGRCVSLYFGTGDLGTNWVLRKQYGASIRCIIDNTNE